MANFEIFAKGPPLHFGQNWPFWVPFTKIAITQPILVVSHRLGNQYKLE